MSSGFMLLQVTCHVNGNRLNGLDLCRSFMVYPGLCVSMAAEISMLVERRAESPREESMRPRAKRDI